MPREESCIRRYCSEVWGFRATDEAGPDNDTVNESIVRHRVLPLLVQPKDLATDSE
jgi:hypothetical protein